MMNEAIAAILNHRSIRSFQDRPLSDEQIHMIVKCAQAAATSSFVQAYTIIGIKDPHKKAKLAELAGNQNYVLKNGHFFVFCLDSRRHEAAIEMEGLDPEEVREAFESTEWFMVGLIDAALAAQNAVLAAESMGLGICFIGAIRNNLQEVSELLKTPDRVIPLFGLCVGYPDNESSQKQRLPLANIYHEEEYLQDSELFKQQLEQYNQDISAYYHDRTGGARVDRWTQQITAKLKKPSRLYMKRFLESKKFPLK